MNSKIKKSLFFLFFILSGIFFPVRFVLAGWARELGLWIATWPIFQIAKMLIDLAIFIAGLCGRLLNWVLSPNFIKLPYTTPGQPPTGNPIIEAGLGVTQGFVNMILVLVLVYIAIATILRLAGYETKKLLVTFIIVALLVNFAPVLCGLIIDAANIIMNFFVQDLKADAFGESMGTRVSQILSGYDATSTWEQARPFMMQIIIMVPFLFALSFVLLIFTAIFILRYLVIWLLVILSPLAFVAYILPATRKYFEQWWKQFLAWTFIGVTCGFFLYLGLMLVTYVPTAITPPTTGQTGAFDAVLPYFVALIFLGIGIVFGLSTSAMGASTVINFAKSKGKAGAKWAARRIPEGTMAATAGAARGLLQKTKEGEPKLGAWGRTKATFKGAATYEGREKGREAVGHFLERRHLVRPGAYETARRKRWKIEEETKRLDTLPTDRLQDISERKAITPAEKRAQVAAVEVLAKRGTIGGPKGSKREEKMRQLLPKMQSLGADTKQILKVRPDWAPLVGKDINKVVAGTSRRDSINFQAEALKDERVVIHLDSSKIQDIRSRGSTEQKNVLNNTIKELKTYGPAFERSLARARKIQKEADQLRQEKKQGWEKEFEKKTKEWHITVDGLKKFKQDPDFK